MQQAFRQPFSQHAGAVCLRLMVSVAEATVCANIGWLHYSRHYLTFDGRRVVTNGTYVPELLKNN
jgi:hypothetical protein